MIYSIGLAIDMINIEGDGEEGDILNRRDPSQAQSALPPFSHIHQPGAAGFWRHISIVRPAWRSINVFTTCFSRTRSGKRPVFWGTRVKTK